VTTHAAPQLEINEPRARKSLLQTMGFDDVFPKRLELHLYSERKVGRGTRGPACGKGRV
jgi:hypothetical protein